MVTIVTHKFKMSPLYVLSRALLCLGLPWSFSLRLPHQRSHILFYLPPPTIRATCTANFRSLRLTPIITFGKKCQSEPLINVKRRDRLWGPPSLLFSGYRRSFPRRQFDQSPRTTTEFQNEWSYTSTPPTCFHGMDSNNFKFSL